MAVASQVIRRILVDHARARGAAKRGGERRRIMTTGLMSSVPEEKVDLLGLDDTLVESKFGFMLEALELGAPPHGGIALGWDRLAMILAGEASLREVIAFPKTTSAQCLLTRSPGTASPQQLEELGIATIKKPDDESA